MKHLEPISRWRDTWMCWPKVQRTYGSWKHWIVLPPTCHLGPWPGGCHPVALIQNIDWRYMWLWWKNWGQYPHPLTLGQPPLVEDMLHDARNGFTKAVVTGQGRAVLFYGRHSMGEDLTIDEAKMPHSYSQELVPGLEKWPTSPQTQWQFKRVKGPLLKLYQIIELRWEDQDITVWIC